MLSYTPQIIFWLPFSEYDFMIAKLAVLKISEMSQEHSRGGVLC